MKYSINTLLRTFLILALYNISGNSYSEPSKTVDHSHHKHMMKDMNKNFTITNEKFNLLDVELITSSGNKTTLLKELDTNTPILLNFIFTSCTAICPIMSGTFSAVNKKLNNKPIKMISISIDPEYDTPQALKKYAKRFKADEKWNFYTGSVKNIISIQQSFFDYRGNKMNHEPSTYFRQGKHSNWLKVNGFISSNELVEIYNKNKNM